jgi:hypothetical protein
LYSSLDGGVSWHPLEVPGVPYNVQFDQRDVDRRAVILATTTQVLWSPDLGETWVDLGRPEPREMRPVWDRFGLLLLGDTVFLGTENGLWRRPLP